MDAKEFKVEGLRTEPSAEQYEEAKNRLAKEPVAVGLILEFRMLFAQLTKLDALKKHIFYGKENELINNLFQMYDQMKKNENIVTKEQREIFTEQVSFLNEGEEGIRFLHAIMGINTEGGELIEALLKALDNKAFDKVNVMEESFDVDWYQNLLQDVGEYTEEHMRDVGIAKLRRRFPHAFSESQAINRDTESERKALEGN